MLQLFSTRSKNQEVHKSWNAHSYAQIKKVRKPTVAQSFLASIHSEWKIPSVQPSASTPNSTLPPSNQITRTASTWM